MERKGIRVERKKEDAFKIEENQIHTEVLMNEVNATYAYCLNLNKVFFFKSHDKTVISL